MPKQPPGDDNVGRMQFLLGLRRRGIADPAVLWTRCRASIS